MLTGGQEFEKILLEFEKDFLDDEENRLGIHDKFLDIGTRQVAFDDARPEFEKISGDEDEYGVNVATAGTVITSWRAALACQRGLLVP